MDSGEMGDRVYGGGERSENEALFSLWYNT